MRNIVVSLVLVGIVYICLTLSSITMYGSHIAQSLLANIGVAYKDDRIYVESYAMQILFLVVLAAHIPYIFYSAKESLLIIIDECMRRSISLTLSKKMLPNLEDNMKKSMRITSRMSMNNQEHHDSQGHSHDLDQQDLFHDHKEIELDESQQGEIMQLNLVNVRHQSFAIAHARMLSHSIPMNRKIRQTIELALPKNLNSLPSNKLTALAYKSMSNWIYYSVTVALFALQLYLAIVLTDLGDIFGFVGTFSATSLCYFNPSLLFIIAVKDYATRYYKDDHRGWIVTAYVNLALGLVCFGLFLYSNILTI